jgi:glycosyltransferase involved in cell wall biosynthesis
MLDDEATSPTDIRLEKMVVIPNGIDVERFHPNIEARARIREEWGTVG